MIEDVRGAAAADVDTHAESEPWLDSVLVATAVALVVLLPVELMSWLLVSDVTEHDAGWVVDRWSSSLWRAVDWVFLVVALVHGVLSTSRWLTSAPSAWRQAAAGVLVAVGSALLLVASYAFFTLDVP